jgi:hypothetical protein
MFEGEAVASLGDAAFTKDETLPAITKGLTNEGPFFKCHAHKLEFILYTTSFNKGNTLHYDSSLRSPRAFVFFQGCVQLAGGVDCGGA